MSRRFPAQREKTLSVPTSKSTAFGTSNRNKDGAVKLECLHWVLLLLLAAAAAVLVVVWWWWCGVVVGERRGT